MKTKVKTKPRRRSEFDEELVIESFQSPSPAQRARWKAARRKRGRPTKGLGARVVSVTIEKGLLARSDAAARRLGITRSELIARGLRAALAATA